nr:lipopolysaccharide heptosyltransferase I [Herbaspirillum sp. ASV7]
MKILIVRVSSLGDVVHNMPMVADIRRHFPGAQIDWVVEEGYTSLVRLNPLVHNIIPIALRRWRKTLFSAATRAEISAFYRTLRVDQYDVVFDTQGLLKTSVVMRMARLACGGKRVGLANATEGSGYEPISRIFHDRSVKVGLRTHAVMRARLVAADALGYTLDHEADFALQAPPQQRFPWMPDHPYAVFFHGTARADKQWPQDEWIKLGQALFVRGLPVLLPWGNKKEQQAAHVLAAQIPGAQVLPALPLIEAVGLVQQARLVVGLDTGLTHIAAAYCKPTVELYCDSPRWKTEGNWSPNIINLGDIGTPPGGEVVLAAVEKLLY